MNNLNFIAFIRLTALSLLLFFNITGQDNNLEFSHLTTADGLSVNIVTKIFQDSKGFLWFGTFNGLNRYDGYKFKIFQPDPLNPKSISSHSIVNIFEDSKGYIWIATNNGLNRYDWKTEEFVRYLSDPKIPNSISFDYVYSIYEDAQRTLWVGTPNGLNKYNREKDNFAWMKIDNTKLHYSLYSITCIQEDSGGNLWLGTWDGLLHIQKNGKLINQFTHDPKDSKSLGDNRVKTILIDNQGILWIGTDGSGLDKLNVNTGIFTHYRVMPAGDNHISNDFVRTIFKDGENNLWIGTKSGLNKFDAKNNIFSHFFHDPLKPLSIANNDIYSVAEDETGLIWVATSRGISSFFQPHNKFNYFFENNYSKNKLSRSRVNSIFIDKEKHIWAGTKDGLIEVKPGRQIELYRNDPSNINSLSDDYVKCAIKDHLGLLWIGTDGGGLNCYNPKTNEYKLYKNTGDLESISNDGVTALCEDYRGSLWIGTYFGLNRLDRKREKFIRYSVDISSSNSIKNGIIWVIFEDSEKMLWIGTDGGGVSLFNPQTSKFTNFLADSSMDNNICGNRVFGINETKDGTMWFGTTDGLSSFDRKTGKFINYNKSNGMVSNAANSIIEDLKGNLWISTDKGLSMLNRKNGVFSNYTRRSGLPETEYSPNASAMTDDGTLYFASSSGLIFFNPAHINDEYLSAPLVFTDFKIYNQSLPIDKKGILKESITNTKIIELPGGNDVITFEFALLDYFEVGRNTFQYKLEGFDRDWNNVGTRNEATYTNLPPGEYKFLVKASNNSGIKNEKDASLQVIIVPVFYQTWWFRFVFGSGAIILTFLIINLRTKTIQKHNKVLESKVIERTKDLDKTINELSQEIVERKKAEEKVHASLEEKGMLLSEKEVLLKEIHHRVKNNLQVISSLLYLNSRKIKDSETLDMFKESQNRVKSIALVHERLYGSKDLARIDFKDYVQLLTKDLFRSYAVDQSIVKLELNINDVLINIDTAVPCALIINELISNSLKYAFPGFEEEKKQGIIKVDFNHDIDGDLLLIISDNGIGIPEEVDEKKKLSLGLQLVDTLVAQLEGTLEYDLQQGTTYKIRLKASSN